ncbi:low molecular weight protein-tyrosine-phosphatase [Thauera sp.]|uniref:low molecular weight protein-tyrosine-phosphatase n=1 Tax=Thauera sp. TaxID=1905334 RepID=UPI002CC038A4|nr:low molecular weight protein-tyrosine-phosphatase [Thauera sp.]HRO37988.1 low molecular weight protein-tyrosine-phosphatase [Thauera sp.]
MFDKILTLCTGNICRSPLAEFLLRDRLAARGRAATVASAGIGALAGHPADETTQRVALRHGIDLSPHIARQLTTDITRWADLILVMERHHLEYATRLDPSARGKIFLLGHWDKAEVPDPYRLAEENHQLAYDIIAHTVDQWIGKL